jgi:trans-2-enoyl-CoA reductase
VSENLDFYVDQKSYKEIFLETHGVQEENIRYSKWKRVEVKKKGKRKSFL